MKSKTLLVIIGAIVSALVVIGIIIISIEKQQQKQKKIAYHMAEDAIKEWRTKVINEIEGS